MRAILLALLWCTAAANGQELMRVERTFQPLFVAPSKKTTPSKTVQESAKRQSLAWLKQYTADAPKGWKPGEWEYRGDYYGAMTGGDRWSFYRLTLNPPLESNGEPRFELFFGFFNKDLVFPDPNHSKNQPLPRPPAPIQDSATKSVLGVRQVP